DPPSRHGHQLVVRGGADVHQRVMMRRVPFSRLLVASVIAVLAALPAPLAGQTRRTPAPRTPTQRPPAAPKTRAQPPEPKVEPAAMTCPQPLGTGVQTKRLFCDVLVGRDPAGGIIITLPPH